MAIPQHDVMESPTTPIGALRSADTNNKAPLGLVQGEPEQDHSIAARQLTQLQLTVLRFRRHRMATVGLFVLVLIALSAIFAPLLTPENPYDPLTFDPANANIAPTFSNWDFLLGTDVNGHSILSQVLWGGRVSLTVGIVSALLVSVIGFVVGATAGYFGGWVDSIMMRVTDIFLTLPTLPVLLIAAAFLGQGNPVIVIVIFSFFGWPGIARLVRGSYLSLRNQEFVEAARAVGASNRRIIFRHIAPSAIRPVIVAATLGVAGFILGEAAIDYLGVGISPPTPSWGNVLSGAQDSFGSGNWWWPVFPGVMLVLTILSVNFIGDGLGDALDVKSRL